MVEARYGCFYVDSRFHLGGNYIPLAGYWPNALVKEMPISNAIDELEIVVSCSDPEEWKSLVRHIPL